MTIVMTEGYQCHAQRYEGTPTYGQGVECTGRMESNDDILVCSKCGRIALREDRVAARVKARRA